MGGEGIELLLRLGPEHRKGSDQVDGSMDGGWGRRQRCVGADKETTSEVESEVSLVPDRFRPTEGGKGGPQAMVEGVLRECRVATNGGSGRGNEGCEPYSLR